MPRVNGNRRLRAVPEDEFRRLAHAYRGADHLLAAYEGRDGTLVLSAYWPADAPVAEFYWGPYSPPGRDGSFSMPLERFVADHGEDLREAGLARELALIEKSLDGSVAPGRLVTRLRANWAERHHHAGKDEREALEAALRPPGGDDAASDPGSDASRPPATSAPAPDVTGDGEATLDGAAARTVTTGGRAPGRWTFRGLLLVCAPLALICGALFATRVDNASPVDGAMLGVVLGAFLFGVLRRAGARSERAAYHAAVWLCVAMIAIGHLSAFELHRELIAEGRAPGYAAELRALHEAPSGIAFVDHLRAMAARGTIAAEKPFPYFPLEDVRREGGWVWFAWLRQLLWAVFFAWSGVFFGVDRFARREASA